MNKKELKLHNIIREIVLAELTKQNQKVFFNSSENAKGISGIVDRETRNAVTISKTLAKLEAQIHCGVTYGHRFTLVRYLGTCYVFRCTNCGLEYNRPEDNLTRKESELVVLVFSENKTKGKK